MRHVIPAQINDQKCDVVLYFIYAIVHHIHPRCLFYFPLYSIEVIDDFLAVMMESGAVLLSATRLYKYNISLDFSNILDEM